MLTEIYRVFLQAVQYSGMKWGKYFQLFAFLSLGIAFK